MKKRREEEQRKKSEEWAKKAEERAKQKAEKEARKMEQQAQRRKGKGKQPATKRTKNAQSTRPMKCPRTDSAEVNDSECCVCFVSYDNDQSGGDWVACACGRGGSIRIVQMTAS